MKAIPWIIALSLVAVGFSLAQDFGAARPTSEPELAFFFSDSTKDLEQATGAIRALRAKQPKLRIKPVFLVEDFASIATPTETFASVIRELRSVVGPEFALPIYDEDGLALARRIKIDRLPAFAVIATHGDTKRASLAYGSRANLEELLRCAR